MKHVSMTINALRKDSFKYFRDYLFRIQKRCKINKMEAEIKRDGIFISKEILKKLGLEDFGVEMSAGALKIRPRSYTKRMFGVFKAEEKLVDQAIEEYEREKERRYFGEE